MGEVHATVIMADMVMTVDFDMVDKPATVMVRDMLTGERREFEMPVKTAAKMVAVALHGDEGFEEFYPEIEAVLEPLKLPNNLRPIP